ADRDTDGDGTIDALDPDDDNDGIMTALENADPNGDGNPADALDSNDDSNPDYLDINNEPVSSSEKVEAYIIVSDKNTAKSIPSATLYYPFRSAEPERSTGAADYIDLVIKQLKNNPDVRIRLTGHTDSVGRAASNRKLGLERAQEIRDLLVDRGAPESQIELDSKGEEEPVASNQTEQGRQKNRRVELEPVVESTTKTNMNGERVYRTLCFSCHDYGIANSPLIGDKVTWESIIKQGLEVVYTNSINGKGAHPSRGGNPSLSDDEVKAAVDWMLEQN
ncbi:MAG: OmpA family protein, partial [Thiolinea sp.]